MASSSKYERVEPLTEKREEGKAEEEQPKEAVGQRRLKITMTLYLQTLKNYAERLGIEEYTAEWKQLIEERETAQKKLRLDMPTLESHAAELGIVKNTKDWEHVLKDREAIEEHLHLCERSVHDPRDFQSAAMWKNHIRDQLGLFKIHLFIPHIYVSVCGNKSKSHLTMHHHDSLASTQWEAVKQRVENAGDGPVRVQVYLGYPDSWLDAWWDQDGQDHLEWTKLRRRRRSLPRLEIPPGQIPESPVRSSQPSSRKRPNDSSEENTASAKKLQIDT